MACEAPVLVIEAAAWAASRLYRCAQFLVYREIGPDIVEAEFAQACPAPSPEVCYSVDLAFCFLPDLIALARGISPEDPLTLGLTDLARRWPLSSVGVRGIGEDLGDLGFLDDPSLRRLYADRIIERGDVERLREWRAAEAVREALGAFPRLASQAIIGALDGVLRAGGVASPGPSVQGDLCHE